MALLDRINPRKLTDLADREVIPLYIEEMRAADDVSIIPMFLRGYAADYLRDVSVDASLLESLAIFVADQTYRFASQALLQDTYVNAYFAGVIAYLWDCIRERGVKMFYVVDNTMTDERFQLAYSLFLRSNVAVITPYDGLTTWDEIRGLIRVQMIAGRHIAYIEKDASVNYIDAVAETASRSFYVGVIRNRAPEDPGVIRIENMPPAAT